MADEILESFKKTGIAQGWWFERKIAVALSGGGDSMALLWLLTNAWAGKVLAIHVEHGIRGESSLKDAEFVLSHCSKIGVECKVIRRSVPKEAKKGESLEAAARRIRHQVLVESCLESGASSVLLGHNSDDVVETFFLNLARGSGIWGLSGIPESKGILKRPLLGFSREDLREILRKAAWPWVEDETNSQDLYLRNRMRNEILPLMERRLNPKIRSHVLALTKDLWVLRQDEDSKGKGLLDKAKAFLPFCLLTLSRQKVMEMDELEKTHLFRYAGRSLGLRTLSRSRTEKLLALTESKVRFRFQWCFDVELCFDSDSMSWVRRKTLESPGFAPFPLEKSGEKDLDKLSFKWSFMWKKGDYKPSLTEKSLSLPVFKEDKIGLLALSCVQEKPRGRFPWWIKSKIPVLTKNSKAVWTPKLGDWTGRWDFPKNSVKCDGLFEMRFTGRQGEQEEEFINGV